MDSITAAGIAIVADSSSLAFGHGLDALSDTTADTQVDPTAGFADAEGYAIGPDGSDANATASVFGEDTEFSFYTESQADGFDPNARLTTVSTFAFLSVGPSDISGGSEAASLSRNTFATSATDLEIARENVSANGFAIADSVGVRRSGVEAATSVIEQWQPDTHYIMVEASGRGNDVTTSAASVHTSAQRGATTINVFATSEGASKGVSHAVAEARIITTNNLTIAAARGSSTLQGRVLLEPSAATDIDVTGGLFDATSLEREFKLSRHASSTTLAIITVSPDP